eukprot:14494867-Alexandrium_andersonii.AAC.1
MCRPLVYCCVIRAGWPLDPAQAYARFQEGLSTHGTYGAALGAPVLSDFRNIDPVCLAGPGGLDTRSAVDAVPDQSDEVKPEQAAQ